MAKTKVKTRGLTDLNVTNAKIAAGTIDVTAKITGVVPAANLGSGTASSSTYLAGDSTYKTISEYDDDKLQSNIALLGFKCAVNGSLAKYNLVDQIIDEYEDATGIDAGASTNEILDAGVYFGGAISNPTGATSTDTSVSGYRIEVLSAASGSLVIASSANVDVLVVGGGGSGGCGYAGGGGAGGLIYKAAHALTAQTYAWVTGAGGAGQTTSDANGNTGADSTWTDASASVEFTAKGGGAGSGAGTAAGGQGEDGGSGGGNSYSVSTPGSETQSAQSGDSGTYGFGFDGGTGNGDNVSPYASGGGGGAGSVGDDGDSSDSGDGGTGKDYSAIFGTAVGDSGWFASGGGGGWSSGGAAAGSASSGGGTAGGTPSAGASSAATANTGGGSGGGASGNGNSGAGGSGIILVKYADGAFVVAGSDLTLQSTDTTAMTEPDYADMVMLMENASGTATLNTDIKGYISEDSGVTFTQGTLVDEGTWGTNKKILAFHDLDISAQSGTSMCYKITTHNQSAGSKVTKIHATSIGWR